MAIQNHIKNGLKILLVCVISSIILVPFFLFFSIVQIQNGIVAIVVILIMLMVWILSAGWMVSKFWHWGLREIESIIVQQLMYMLEYTSVYM